MPLEHSFKLIQFILFIFISGTTHATNSESDIILNNDNDNNSNTKSSNMPASVVILLLFIFTSLALICIREVRKDYLANQHYLLKKSVGNIHTTNKDRYGSTNHSASYGSASSPNLSSQNIDEYIDDNLYNNANILSKINNIKSRVVQTFINYMERTPPPVCYQVNPDKSVGAFCDNPSKHFNCNNPPIKHSKGFNPIPSKAMKSLLESKGNKNKNQIQTVYWDNDDDDDNNDGDVDDDEEDEKLNAMINSKYVKCAKATYSANDNEYDSISDHNQCKITVNNDNDNDIDADGYAKIGDTNNDNVIKNNYSDSDKELSDNDDVNKLPDQIPNMERKIVILDLD